MFKNKRNQKSKKLIEITVFIGASISEVYYVSWEEVEINLVGKAPVSDCEIHIPSLEADKKLMLLNKNTGRWFIHKSVYPNIKCHQSSNSNRKGIVLNDLGPIEILNDEIYLIQFSVARIFIRATKSLDAVLDKKKNEDQVTLQSLIMGITFAIFTFFFLGYFRSLTI